MEKPQKTTRPAKKKHFVLLGRVKDFFREQSENVKHEFDDIVLKLERDGHLNYPYGEKIEGEGLFAIRVMQSGNIRVFYVYGRYDIVYGIHGYVKKTEFIPAKELKQARRMLKLLIQRGAL